MSKRKDDSIINQIAAMVKTQPGCTGAELSRWLGNPGAYRRLSEIKKLGLVKKGGKRLCAVSDKYVSTWYPDDSQPEPERGETDKQKIRRLEGRIDYLVNENKRLSKMVNATEA